MRVLHSDSIFAPDPVSTLASEWDAARQKACLEGVGMVKEVRASSGKGIDGATKAGLWNTLFSLNLSWAVPRFSFGIDAP